MAKKTANFMDEILTEMNLKIGNKDVSIQKLDGVARVGIGAIPSGSIALDMALGIGGLPKGRMIEIYGPESSGKTTLTLFFIAMALRLDANAWALFVDAEHAMDPTYAAAMGVDLSRCLINQCGTGEEGFQVVETAITSSHPPAIIVCDSVAAFVPKSELEFEMNSDKNAQPGQQAKMMSLGLRKLTGYVAKSETTVIWINQLREKIGVMFGSPETTPGGKALKFYASIRLDIRKLKPIIGENDEIIGNNVKVKVVKNKVAPPFKIAEFKILFGEGIDEVADLLQTGEALGVITKEGNTATFGENTWKTETTFAALWEDDLFKESLREAVRAAAFPPEEVAA